MEDYIKALEKLNEALDKFNKNQTRLCNELEKAVLILNQADNE